MIKIYNFDNLISSGVGYGGHGGSKKGIIFENERWFLKYPKSTKSMRDVAFSYTTTLISEYIGSHIYLSVGIDTHKTKIGIANGKVVVACKDFLTPEEAIFDYNSIKNEYDEKTENILESISSSILDNTSNNLEEIMVVMENNPYFKKVPELKDRFWDMFIIDALINNNDRNEGNWGLIVNRQTGNLKIAPVYDNGAAFYNKADNQKIESILNNPTKLKQSAYDSDISIFRFNDKKINPLKFIESKMNDDCNKAIIRIAPQINLEQIKNIINEITETYGEYKIISKEQKELYYKVLELRYESVLLPIYNELKQTTY